MNQEEEVPTRVTRGALRRRSIDQDATPQNPHGTGTSVTGGTPKKAASAVKKGSTLGAIQEGQGRPSTPVGGGRGTRGRRMSETIDTPTTAPNKLVQNLKDSESVVGSGPGRRSRNTSLTLTEENVQELNAANEDTGVTVRTRTPARLRASHETLTSTTPQTAPTAVRRSTRRNSVTSDDGSVQSLPITTPKTPIARALKVEPIVEEEIPGGDRAGSDSSARNTPGRASTPRAVSQSPRGKAPSPLVTVKQEMTPPRGSVSPQQSSSSARKTPNSTPRSKNVSFTDDSKQEDHQSGYPKTPTSPGKKFVLVGVNDLRNTQLINGTPKANAVIVLGGSDEKAGTPRSEQVSANNSPTMPAVGGESAGNDASDATAKVEGNEKKDTETIAPSPATESVDAGTPADNAVPLNISSSIPSADRSVVAASNEVSGIDVLESSVLEDVVNTSNVTNGQTTEGEPFSKYWSHSVRGTTTKGIDAFSVRKQEEKKAEEEQKSLDASLQRSSKTPEKKIQPSKSESDEEEEEEQEEQEDDKRDKRHEFVDDEAMEVDGYQSGDSLDEEIRQEMAKNEIPDQGEDLGTDDTEEDVEDGEQEDENDSFIVTDDDDEELDEDALLAGTGDDLSTDGTPVKTPKEKTTPHRRRIVQMVDDSEEEEEKAKKLSTPTSSERSLSDRRKRSVKQLTTTDEEASPEKKANRSVMTEDEEESVVMVEGKDQLADEQKRTPGKLNNTTGEAKEATPAKTGKLSETATPSKAADVSAKSVPKSPGQSVHESDSSFAEVFGEKRDVSGDSATKEEDEESTKTAEKSVSFEATSRKSLPSVASRKESGQAVARKSLPAGTKMQFVEEVVTEELHPSTCNLEASYQEEEDEIEDGKQQKEKHDEQDVAKNGVDEEGAEKTPSNTVTSDEEYYEASEIIDEESQTVQQGQKHVEAKQAARDKESITREQSVAPVKPARKPVAPLISAQFYLGGSKKEKSNTVAGGEEATIGVTSTPNQKPSAKKNKKSAVSTNLVANPFALASAKAKMRLSMDSAAAGPAGDPDVAVQKTKKNRNSLPVMKLGAAGPDSKSKPNASVEEEADRPPQQQQQQQPQPLDEPEPMEVDESVEEDGQKENGDEEAGEDKQPDQKGTVEAKSKTPKKKPKALAEFDLESILTRCNEVVRADKERKKQFATLAQQKRDEKRRLRELRQQLEKLESTDGNGEGTQQRDDGADDETKPNITTSANDESGEQPSRDDPAKKKKKRKKKVKNYILEELAELKKDRVSEALLRKMEANEERKQRKKERRAEKMKLLNKENGDVRGGAPDGIGAKLEKVAKKKQKQRMETAAAEEELKQQPSVRVAVSAFAVFQQLQNGHATLQPVVDVPLGGGDGKKPTKVADVDAPPVAKSIEKQEPLEEKPKEHAKKLQKKQPKKPHPEDDKETVAIDVQPKEEHPKVAGKKKEQQPEKSKKMPEEKKLAPENPKLLVAKTPTADDVTAIKKKKKAEVKTTPPAEAAEVQKAASESQLGQRETDVSAEKLKRKQKKAEVVAAAAVDVGFVAPEHDPLPQGETRKTKKQKKNKIEKMAAFEEEDRKMEVQVNAIPELKPHKEKKRVPAAEFFVVPEAAEPEPLPQQETGKIKKQKKNKADKIVVPVEEEVHDIGEPLSAKESKKANKKGALAKASAVNGGLEKKKLGTNKPKEEESIVTSALREIRAVLDESKKNKKASKDKKGKKNEMDGMQDDAVVVAAADPPKKRKRDPHDGSSTSSTPRPTKLRALQRADLGFVEETVTPDKTRLKRNFGFEEVQATPKAVGFKVTSLLPTDDLRTLAKDSAKADKRKKLKKTETVPEPSHSLPLPVWTRSGYFIEAPDKESERAKKKATNEESKKKPNATAGGMATSSYIPLKGHEGFKLGMLRGMPNGGGTSSSAAAATTPKPHRINPDTVAPSVVNFKRQQLLEKTAHLREKKKGGRM